MCGGGCFGGGIGSILGSILGIALAPETGGLSLALPALGGAAGGFGGTALGDAITGQPFNVGEAALAGAGGGLGGLAAGAGGLGEVLSGLGGGASSAAGGLPGLGADLSGGFGADLAGGAGGALAGAGGGFGADLSSGGLGGISDVLPGLNVGGTMPTIPSASPSFSAGLDMGGSPIGGGGASAASAANPFGTLPEGIANADQAASLGLPIQQGDLPAGGVGAGGSSAPALSTDQEIAQWSALGQDPASRAALAGVTGADPTAQPFASNAASNAVAQAGGPVTFNPSTGLNTTPKAGGLMSGITDFLKNNSTEIGLGTTALGIGKSLWSNAQMQGGIDLLMQQARQAQMFMGEFQNSYQNLINTALPLIQQGANGQINPGQAANVLATANRMKTEIKSRYASMGGGNSTNLQQDLGNVDSIIALLQQSMAMSQLNAGVALAAGAGSQGGLNQGSLSSIGQFARLNAASDQDLTDALAGLSKAATSAGMKV